MADHSPATPATRAALAAFRDRYELCGPFDEDWPELCLAAALLALADHRQAPARESQPIDWWDPGERTRRELRIMAAELEGQP